MKSAEMSDIGSVRCSEATLNNFAVYPWHRYANLSQERGLSISRGSLDVTQRFSHFISRTNNKLPTNKIHGAHKQSWIRRRRPREFNYFKTAKPSRGESRQRVS